MNTILIQFGFIVLLVIHKCMGDHNVLVDALLPIPTQPYLAPKTRPSLIQICPAPYYQVDGLNKCYLFVNNYAHFMDAKADCESKQGSLIKIETNEERKWLNTLMPAGYGVWIGAVDYRNGSIIWFDGTLLSKLPGCPESPQYIEGNELYVAKTSRERGGVRLGTFQTFTYVCKRDLLRYI